MKRSVCLPIGGLALLVSLPVLAQTPIGSQFQVNTYTAGNQGYPLQTSCGYWKERSLDIASDAPGNFLVVWQSEDQDGDQDGIFGQRFDSSGVKQGGEFQVNVTTAGPQRTPVVAMEAAGNFVVVWNSWDPGYGQYDIFARRFDSSGSPIGSEFQVSQDSYTYGNPEARVDASGNLVVVWEREGPGFDGRQIMARRFGSSGAPLGGEFQVSDGTYEFHWNRTPDVAVASGGEFVVAWTAIPGYYGGYAVVARRYDSSGNPQGGEFQVNTQPSYSYQGYTYYFSGKFESSPAVTATSSGRFLFAWSSSSIDPHGDSPGDDGGYYDIAARFFDSGGTAIGAEFRVNTTSYYSNEGCPTVGELSDGEFVVAWNSYPYGAFGQVIDGSGTRIGSELPVTTDAARQPWTQTPVVAARETRFVVAWTDRYPSSLKGYDVFGQRFDASGPLACTSAPRVACRGQTKHRGAFRFRAPSNPARKSLTWRAPTLEATTFADFGDPFTDTDYVLCVYDDSAAGQPVLQARMPAGGICNVKPCWTELSPPGKAIRYLETLGDPDGIKLVLLRSGDEGRARVSTRGRGEHLTLPSDPLTPPVTVQLQASNGLCVTARYEERIRRNEPGNFVGRPGSPSGAFLDPSTALVE